MSLLVAEGHLWANRYPLGRLATEAEIVRERKRLDRADQMVIDQTVLAAGMGWGHKAKNAFTTLLKGLRG